MVWEMLLKEAGEMKIPTWCPFQELVAIGMFLVYLFLVSFSKNGKYYGTVFLIDIRDLLLKLEIVSRTTFVRRQEK